MDWGAALGGMDDELKNILVRNKMSQDNQLNVLKSGVDIQNVVADNARADQAQADTTAYRKQDIDTKNRAIKRLEDLDLNKQHDQEEMDKLTSAWASMPEGPEKVQAGQLLSAKIKGFKPGGSVLSVVTNPDGSQTLQNLGPKNIGDQVVTPKAAAAEGYVPDADTLASAVALAKTGNFGLWNSLVARGAAGNATRAALSKAYGEDVHGNDEYNPVVAKAEYAALSNALKANEQSLNTMQGYSKGLGKNLDVFINTASKIPDSGIPYLNVPWRTVDQKLFGSELVASANAAVLPAIREYVRITGSSPNMTGPIHQTAMNEAEKVLGLGDGATMKQIIDVTNIMRQDMANVENGLSSQNALIKEGLGNIGKRMPKADVAHAEGTVSTPTLGTVTPHPESAAGGGEAKADQFKGFPPLVPAPPNSKGKLPPAIVNAWAVKYGKKPEEAAAYAAASGYDVRP